jgi:hypothetical protein
MQANRPARPAVRASSNMHSKTYAAEILYVVFRNRNLHAVLVVAAFAPDRFSTHFDNLEKLLECATRS